MIEYLAPSGGGGISNLKYIETNLSNADFTKLNTDPLVLIPAITNKTIFPIAASVQYQNTSTNTANNYYGIGALSVFNFYSSVAAHMFALGSFDINTRAGTLYLSNYQFTPPSGFYTLAAPDTPIVLYDDANLLNIFPTFIFKCLYLEI